MKPGRAGHARLAGAPITSALAITLVSRNGQVLAKAVSLSDCTFKAVLVTQCHPDFTVSGVTTSVQGVDLIVSRL